MPDRWHRSGRTSRSCTAAARHPVRVSVSAGTHNPQRGRAASSPAAMRLPTCRQDLTSSYARHPGCDSIPFRQHRRPEQEAIRFRRSECVRKPGVVFDVFRRIGRRAGQATFKYPGPNDTSRAPPGTGLTLAKRTRSTPRRPGHSAPCDAQAIHDIADAHVACTQLGEGPPRRRLRRRACAARSAVKVRSIRRTRPAVGTQPGHAGAGVDSPGYGGSVRESSIPVTSRTR